jgi:hypothetical protein
MFSIVRSGLLGLGFGAALLLSDGTAANAADQAAGEPSPQAITCTMCQVTWVKAPTKNDKGRIVGYKWGKKEPCADCTNALTNFFNTGKFEKSCKACGGDMMMCEAQEATGK